MLYMNISYYTPEFDWQRECVEILHCVIDAYHEEVARALFISPIERSIHPGCGLQHMIILNDPDGDKGKSTFCRIIAGNPSLEGGTKWFTNKNIFAMKNDVTRWAETRNKYVHEYGELARLSQMNLDHLMSDITSTVESCRPLFSMDLQERPRWFYKIGTTNKDQYNYNVVNRRYYGMKVSVDGQMIDNVRLIANFNKIMGSLVHNVQNGMSGAISKDVAQEARYQQDIRIVKTDLMVILKQIISMCHIYTGMIEGRVNVHRVKEWYQIGYADEKNLDGNLTSRTYYVSLTGLSRFATNYVNFSNRKDIKVDRDSIKDAILKLMIDIDVPYDPEGKEISDINAYEKKDEIMYREEHFKWKPLEKVTWVPTLKSSIRGYSLEIAAPHIAKIDALAMKNLLDLQGFLIHAFKFFI
jgi:Virulence-associated protein E